MPPLSALPAAPGALDLAPAADLALLARALALDAAWRAGSWQPMLRGKRLGLLCEDAQGPAAQLFTDAATALGAHVACVRISLTDGSVAEIVRETAGLLARLYDAVECLDMSSALVDKLSRAAAVPFFCGASSEAHRTAALARRWSASADAPADARLRVLQAVLIDALA